MSDGRALCEEIRETLRGNPGITELSRRFGRAGFRLVLSGGAVRNALVRADVEDFDLSTDAPSSVCATVLRGWAEDVHLLGNEVGTVRFWKADQEFDMTPYTSLSGTVWPPLSRDRSITFLRHDLATRDFTVNTICVLLDEGLLFDPFGGVGDLENGILRTPSCPGACIVQRPLRLVRAARFHAAFGLRPTAGLRSAMTEHASLLRRASSPYLRVELEKLLRLPDPGPGLRLLDATGAVPHLVGDGAADRPGTCRPALADAPDLAASLTTALRRAGAHPVLPAHVR
jgi:poly(A) polymerase